MKKLLLLSAFITLAFTSVIAQSKAFTIDDMMKVRRVSDPQISPDGRTVLYVIGDVAFADNRVVSQIFSIPFSGGTPKAITEGAKSSSGPRWSPDGKLVAYLFGGQIWTMSADGNNKKQVTNISTGASQPVWSPDGAKIAFVSDVYPECTNDDCNKALEEKAESSKVQAKITDRLLYRHWTEWRERKRTHVFVVSADGGTATDVTPGDFDSPPYGAASGHDYAFSPDSKWIVFLKNPDKVEAISTNSDVFLAAADGSNAKNITVNNRGYDASPEFSPDGKYIFYRSQATAGFEADRWRLMRYDIAAGTSVELTKDFDRQVDHFALSPDGGTIAFIANERGYNPIFTISSTPSLKPNIRKIVDKVSASGVDFTSDGKSIVFPASSMSAAPEVFVANSDGSSVRALTKTNDAYFADFGFNKPSEIAWKGALGVPSHGFMLKPANFDASKKYPLMVLIHGGPQGAWNDSWSYRWNPQLFANAGYIVFMPNPRGSTGYGQKYVNEVSADWGGRAYGDIMNGVAEAIKDKNVDKERIGGAGASYGGYMVNWILGHNNDPRFKFKSLVSHAGVYNLESMATVTEELWFVDWEFKGSPWENPVNYNRWSPHKFAKNFSTPTLVIHGEIDYRVPVDQGLQLYTTLQRRGVDSKLIYFPDEGHWILKPQNSQLWYNEVLGWFGKYLK